MIVEALHLLARSDFDIWNYQYTGMGSWYFVDFIMFHKAFGLRDMLSVEKYQAWESRVKFNKPYGFIDLKIAEIGQILPTLSKKRKHLVWLDYDERISKDILRDVALAASELTQGSILLITVDVEPPKVEGEPHARKWKKWYETELGSYVSSRLTHHDFAGSALPQRNADFVRLAITEGTEHRDIEFTQLFSFSYADTHQMLTIGGMLGGQAERAKIVASGLASKAYYRGDAKSRPFLIQVPKLTRKERFYLDSQYPFQNGFRPEFALDDEDLKSYAELCFYLPTYAELFL